MRLALAIASVLCCFGCKADGARSAMEPCPGNESAGARIPIASARSQATRTYYVRPDGGDSHQCNGRADAAYSGSGDQRDCAWKNPAIALPASGPARIDAGDILMIARGDYIIGEPMQAVPSGDSAAAPTRLLGKPGRPPKLIGINGIRSVLSLDGSSNVEVGHLEITDDSDCVYKHSRPEASCTDATRWARAGLFARASRNVWLHDLDIHGMAALGINAGALRDWTVERIKLNRNGRAGWDGNVGSEGSNAGRIVMRDIEIGWNGCGERIANHQPWACWAQGSGGYGDGFGTTRTGGQWLIEDAFVHHNTSDGLDLRYMDGADATKVVLRRIKAVANAGNQVKVKGNALIEDSVLVGHCSYFSGKYFMTDKDLCRADGSTLQLVLTGNDVATVRRNTIAGEGAVQIGHSEGDSSDRVVMRDNLVIGFPYFRKPETLSAFNGGKSPAAKSFEGNVAQSVRKCPADTDCDSDPRLRDTSLAAFDARPRTGSRGVRAGAAICGKP